MRRDQEPKNSFVGSESPSKTRSRSDEELGRLVALGREYFGRRFAVRFQGGGRLELGDRVVFEDFERMRSGGGGLPPACIRATLEVALPPGARELQFEHAADSEKRLMLGGRLRGRHDPRTLVATGRIATRSAKDCTV